MLPLRIMYYNMSVIIKAPHIFMSEPSPGQINQHWLLCTRHCNMALQAYALNLVDGRSDPVQASQQ
jgi:hypothetical protein